MTSAVNPDLTTAQPTGFTVLALSQLFNCFNVRSDSRDAFSCLSFNRWLLGLIAIAVFLQVAVAHIGFLNLTFGTAPLTLNQWLLCIAVVSLVVWCSESRKLTIRSLCSNPINLERKP